MKNIQIGNFFYAKSGLWIEAIFSYQGQKFNPSISIGKNVSFSQNVHISSVNSISIGNNVLFGSNIFVSDNHHGVYVGQNQSSPLISPGLRPLFSGREVVIEDNVWVCDGAMILPGSFVGNGSIISAHSIVRGNIPPNCIASGNPCRPVKFFDDLSHQWKKIENNVNFN